MCMWLDINRPNRFHQFFRAMLLPQDFLGFRTKINRLRMRPGFLTRYLSNFKRNEKHVFWWFSTGRYIWHFLWVRYGGYSGYGTVGTVGTVRWVRWVRYGTVGTVGTVRWVRWAYGTVYPPVPRYGACRYRTHRTPYPPYPPYRTTVRGVRGVRYGGYGGYSTTVGTVRGVRWVRIPAPTVPYPPYPPYRTTAPTVPYPLYPLYRTQRTHCTVPTVPTVPYPLYPPYRTTVPNVPHPSPYHHFWGPYPPTEHYSWNLITRYAFFFETHVFPPKSHSNFSVRRYIYIYMYRRTARNGYGHLYIYIYTLERWYRPFKDCTWKTVFWYISLLSHNHNIHSEAF